MRNSRLLLGSALLIICMALVFSLMGCGGKKTPAGKGSINIDSVPQGASVWIDGVDTGQVTPATINDVTAGTRSVSLVLDGYATWTDEVLVVANDTVTVPAVNLNPMPTPTPTSSEEPSPSATPTGTPVKVVTQSYESDTQGWTPWGDGHTITGGIAGGQTGNCINIVTDGTIDWYTCGNFFNSAWGVPINASKKYEIRFWMKLSDSSYKVHFKENKNDKDTLCTVADTDWHQFTVTDLTPGTNVAGGGDTAIGFEMMIQIEDGAATTVYLDEVELWELP